LTRYAKALEMAPSHALLLVNAGDIFLAGGLKEVLSDAIDLDALRADASVSLLDFVSRDESVEAQYRRRVQASAKVARARDCFQRALIVAPKGPTSYRQLASLLHYFQDVPALRSLVSDLERNDLDSSDEKRHMVEACSGVKDKEEREEAMS